MPLPFRTRFVRPSTTARVAMVALTAAVLLTTPRLTPAATASAGTSASAARLPGRPPIGPLSRDVGRVHDVTIKIRLNASPPFRPDRDSRTEIGDVPYFVNTPGYAEFEIDRGTFAMPVATISTWHRTELETLGAELELGDRRFTDAGAAGRMTRSLPYDVQRAEIPIPAFEGQIIGLTFRQRTAVWSSRIDDVAASNLPWPERYPEDVVDGLDPSPAIPSDDPFFAGVVADLFGADVTTVAPYLAAKRIAGHVAKNFQITRPRVYRGLAGTIDGLVVRDTILAAREGAGSPVDLICTTVATMRAAGIPARPVFGVAEGDDGAIDEIRDRETIVAWAEFYLDGAGWVPFDPEELRDNGSWRNRPATDAWPNFGTWDDLNDRVPIAYDFIPGPGFGPAQRPAFYGVTLEGGPECYPAQYVTIGITGRGRV